MAAFAGGSLPSGWLLCNGSAISRETYSALFRAIGTAYGAGDGSTTFSVPNLVDRFIEGGNTAGKTHSAGLPNITGDFEIRAWYTGTAIVSTHEAFASKGLIGMSANRIMADGVAQDSQKISLDASKSNSIYGKSDTVQPPALTMRYAIYTGYVGRHCWLRTA